MVHSPYTPFFTDAFLAGHGAIGLILLALVWSGFVQRGASRWLFSTAIALAVFATLLGEFLHAFGFAPAEPALHIEQWSLLTSSAVLVVALWLERRFGIGVALALAAYATWKLSVWSPTTPCEIAALQLVWIGIGLGAVRRVEKREPVGLDPGRPTQDVALFFIAVLAAGLTATLVLSRADGSADEWAYTWQAAVFAKLHVYAAPPPCENAFQSFYVFSSVGRMFAQYTPGWPLFMAPFFACGVVWLAAPVSLGLLAVGVARVARRALALDPEASAARIGAAGWIAGLSATFATTILLLGASRYAHVLVAALFAWSIEALYVPRQSSPRREVGWGLAFGACIAWMGATRPADGAMLSTGLAVVFLYRLVTRAVSMRRVGGAAAGFVACSALTLIVLRLQLGTWFTTGYSMEAVFHPWNVTKYAWPGPTTWKYALPLATGSYAWFPASLAVGFMGIVSLRGRARSITVLLIVSAVFYELYFQYLNIGRGYDWGYGPRYESPFIVFMSVGTGVAIAPLAARALHAHGAGTALRRGGPFAVVIVAAAITLIRLWPLLYPGVYAHVQRHDGLNRKIRELHLTHALVLAEPGTTGFDALDLTENLPIALYPNQDVLIAIDRSRATRLCLRQAFPDRRELHARGTTNVVIDPR